MQSVVYDRGLRYKGQFVSLKTVPLDLILKKDLILSLPQEMKKELLERLQAIPPSIPIPYWQKRNAGQTEIDNAVMRGRVAMAINDLIGVEKPLIDRLWALPISTTTKKGVE